MPRYTEDEKDRALMQLREWLKPGATVNCILRHKSRSGMSRSISLLAAVGPDMFELDYQASRALGESIDQKHGGIRMGGCGMDMGFALVYNLSRVLFPDGYGCIGEGRDADGKPAPRLNCPSSDHSNGDRDYTPHDEAADSAGVYQDRHSGKWGHATSGPDAPFASQLEAERNGGHWHRDGGYALRHRWM